MNYIYIISFSFLAFNLSLPNKQNMGQTLQKLGSEESKDINPIIDECYQKYFAADPNKDWTSADFYHAICDTVEEINKMLGTTQFHVPDTATLEEAYKATYGQINVIQRLIRYSGESCDLQKHHKGKGKSLTKEEFEKIFHDVILGTGVTGIGIKDLLFYLFGVPVTALFLKQRLIPNALPNEVFIPGVTSATVYLLAKLNKI